MELRSGRVKDFIDLDEYEYFSPVKRYNTRSYATKMATKIKTEPPDYYEYEPPDYYEYEPPTFYEHESPTSPVITQIPFVKLVDIMGKPATNLQPVQIKLEPMDINDAEEAIEYPARKPSFEVNDAKLLEYYRDQLPRRKPKKSRSNRIQKSFGGIVTKRKYCCYICSRFFKHMCRLKTHMPVHTGEAIFQCKQCGKRYTNSSSLLAHRRSHYGEVAQRTLPIRLNDLNRTKENRLNTWTSALMTNRTFTSLKVQPVKRSQLGSRFGKPIGSRFGNQFSNKIGSQLDNNRSFKTRPVFDQELCLHQGPAIRVKEEFPEVKAEPSSSITEFKMETVDFNEPPLETTYSLEPSIQSNKYTPFVWMEQDMEQQITSTKIPKYYPVSSKSGQISKSVTVSDVLKEIQSTNVMNKNWQSIDCNQSISKANQGLSKALNEPCTEKYCGNRLEVDRTKVNRMEVGRSEMNPPKVNRSEVDRSEIDRSGCIVQPKPRAFKFEIWQKETIDSEEWFVDILHQPKPKRNLFPSDSTQQKSPSDKTKEPPLDNAEHVLNSSEIITNGKNTAMAIDYRNFGDIEFIQVKKEIINIC